MVRQTWQNVHFCVETGLVSVIWYTNFATDCFLNTCGGRLLRNLTLSVLDSIAKVHSGCKSDGNASSKVLNNSQAK